MTKPIISIQNLSITFGSGRFLSSAVSDLNLNILPGECVGLVGESGSGKSLTAMALMQLLPHAASVSKQSKILLNDQDILLFSEKKMRNIRGSRIGMIFQDAMSAFNPVFTIGQQLLEVIRTHLKLSNKESKQRAATTLNEVGIKNDQHVMRCYAHELSGGMRQRAMIAMALCAEPKILIADEPTTALDVTLQAQVISLLESLKQKHQMTLLFISHDLAVVSQLADHIVVLQNGMKVEEGTKVEFFAAPKHPYSQQLLNAALPIKPLESQKAITQPLLNVKHLQVYFPIRSNFFKRTIGQVKAVDDISFDIGKGETFALVGESGSGKTTTGKALLKLVKATGGKVIFNDENIMTLSKKSSITFRENIQIIFQDPFSSLNPRMIVADSIAEGLIAQRKVKNHAAAMDRVDELLASVDLSPDMKWRYPHEFSGGQRQRICIARALALNPKLLVLDEPTSALDVSIQMQILKLLKDLQEQRQISFLLITHNISVVAYMAHQIAVMYRGKIVEHGTTAELLANPQHDYTKQLLASVPKISQNEPEKAKS